MTHPNDQQFTTAQVGKNTFWSFDYQQHGLLGVGKQQVPFVNMDEYLDHSRDEELHVETCKGLASVTNYKVGTFVGDIPPFEKERLGKHCWSEVVTHLDEHDPTGVHRQAIEELLDTAPNDGEGFKRVYRYIYFAMDAFIPWYFNVYLKTGTFTNKVNEMAWDDAAKYFPKVKKYVESLPFESTGRVMFFTTLPGTSVVAHRDYPVAEHKDHNINLFFSSGPRKSYVWDDTNDKKIYIPSDCRSYFFNNRDYHGVDADPMFRYTLRVDGTFTKEMQDELGLEDGYTFKWDYRK